MNFEEVKKGLNEEQVKVFDTFFSRRNMFVTGPAGTGKSFVMKRLMDYLDYHKYPIGKTASTGTAAVNIGGSTIFSFAGVGLCDGTKEMVLERLAKNKKAKSRIKGCRALIIDEVSMLRGDVFEKLNYVFKCVRNSFDPFGGVQLVLLGDFLQLDPVFKDGENPSYIFETKTWQDCKIKFVELTKLVRQDEGSNFGKMLQEVRVGNAQNIGLLQKRIGAKFSDEIGAVNLYCRNIDVNKENERRLAQIPSPSFFFNAIDVGEAHHIEYFNKNCPVPARLELKVGAQVMLCKNLDLEAELFNGAVGKVTNISNVGIEVLFKTGKCLVNRESWEIKEQSFTADGKRTDKVIASRNQIPLRLSWASTIHKCQGATLDHANINISEAFSSGQVYTALSRVRDLESLSIQPFSESKIKINQKALKFYQSLKD